MTAHGHTEINIRHFYPEVLSRYDFLDLRFQFNRNFPSLNIVIPPTTQLLELLFGDPAWQAFGRALGRDRGKRKEGSLIPEPSQKRGFQDGFSRFSREELLFWTAVKGKYDFRKNR
jgi:hypothetical protein